VRDRKTLRSRIRVRAKAGNDLALRCYEKTGYRPYEIILAKPLRA
jgi:hypothetical protein